MTSGVRALDPLVDHTRQPDGRFRRGTALDYLAVAPEQELNPLYWIMRNRDLLPPLRIDCGTVDRLIGANRAFHEVLSSAGIKHQYFEYEGDHEWPYWEAHIADSLRFFETLRGGS